MHKPLGNGDETPTKRFLHFPAIFSVNFSGDPELWTELGLEPKAWSLGLKRNVAIELAAGEIIAHFDDDDLYAPGYLTWMHERLGHVLKKDKDPVTGV